MVEMNNLKRTRTYSQIWGKEQDFEDDYKSSPLYDADTSGRMHNSLEDANIKTLYYLLYARYGNSPIANLDENQFKYKVFSIIFQYGPTWQKELEIQDKLRMLSDSDLEQGAKMIYNHAMHDAGAPSTNSLEETFYINEQNSNNQKKSKMGAYGELISLLNTNVSDVFLNRFKICFNPIAIGCDPIYITDLEEV